MHRKEKNVTRSFKIISQLILILCLGFIFKKYSEKLGLFDNINSKIIGNNFVNTIDIEKKIYPLLNQSIFLTNLSEIKHLVTSFDFINSTQISLVLPNTIIIHVLEKDPIILMNIENSNFFMDKNGGFIPAEYKSINFFPVPIITINDSSYNVLEVKTKISNSLIYILEKHPSFYEKLSELIIKNNQWVFFSDDKTQIFATFDNLFIQLNTLKYFQKTVYPKRVLADYLYIDLRIPDQVIVKEKYRKG